jgi:hypothetical protein
VKRNRSRKGRTPRTQVSLLERVNPDVAGIDCGSAEHFVAVPVGRDPNSVQSFRTFTGDLHRLAEWLAACGVRSVAMEATASESSEKAKQFPLTPLTPREISDPP